MSQDTQSSTPQDPDRKLVYFLIVVVAVLALGSIVGGFLLIHKASDLSQANTGYNNDISTLRSQLQQARAAQTPSPTPAATSTPTAPAGH